MRAAVHRAYGSPDEVIHVEDVAEPSIGDDEVLIRVHAAGVNWADASMTTGKPYLMRLGYGIRRPRNGVRGTDVAGTVEAVGREALQYRPGDEVFGWCTRAFAERVAVKAEHVVAKPARLSFAEAAAIPMAGCVALQAVRDIASIRAGQKVLVNGASGGIGTFAVQIAAASGAEVTGVCSARNIDLLRTLGVDRVIDYTTEDFTVGGERYDLILDMADTHTIGQRRRVLTPRGTLIPNSGEGGPWFGSIGRMLKAWAISPFVSQRLRPFLSVAKRDDIQALADMAAAGSLTPVVGRTYPLDEAGAAIAHAGSGHARGKIVITMASSP